jgi:hypothetical protein
LDEGLSSKGRKDILSKIKRLIEEVAGLVHDAKRDELEAMLEPWDDCQKVAILMEAITLNRLICSGYCPCEGGDK